MSNQASLKLSSAEQYQHEYSKLNLEQRQAVDAIDGPVMVLAGPGTGKTQVLALRIANILRQTDVGPRGILAMTFTDAAAQNMRERLLRVVGLDAYAITIVTFHAFCAEVIRDNPESFPQFGMSVPLTDPDKFEVMRAILDNNHFEQLRPPNTPYRNIKKILTAIGELKQENLSQMEFRKLLQEERLAFEAEKSQLRDTVMRKRLKALEQQEELAEIYALYEKELQKRNFFDFHDMLLSVGEVFAKNEYLLRQYQEQYSYFLADEYQDTNGAQNAILDLLAGFWAGQANIFVVGDVHQSIFRFQGASLENTLGFLHRYPAAKVISLKQNYRSGQKILNAAAGIIQQSATLPAGGAADTAFFSKIEPLHAVPGRVDLPIRVAVLPTEFAEHAFIAEDIRKKIAAGVSPSEIAILVKENKEVTEVARVCAKLKVPAHIVSGDGVLGEPCIQQAITLLRAIQDLRQGTDVHLFTYLSYPWVGINHADLLLINRYVSGVRKTLGELLLAGESALPEELKLSNAPFFWQKIQQLLLWSQSEASLAFEEWVEVLFQESGLLDAVWKGQSSVSDLSIAFEDVSISDQLSALQSFFELIKQWSKHYTFPSRLRLDHVLQRLDIIQQHELTIPRAPLEVDIPAVSILTAHKAKGMEWQHVYLIGCSDKHWGNAKSKERIDLPSGVLHHQPVAHEERKLLENEDARRLFYVAMTRAKDELCISYPQSVMKTGKMTDQSASMFVKQLNPDYLSMEDIADFLAGSIEELKRYMLQPKEENFGPRLRDWLVKQTQDLVLYPTHLNTYLECPRKYLFNTLARLPSAKTSVSAFGISVHAALEFYFSTWLHKGTRPELPALLHVFEKALEKEGLPEHEFSVRLAQGTSKLTAYMEHYSNHFREPAAVETKLGGKQILEVEGIRIGGKLDKVEWIDKAKKEVCIIDYKTGQARTRNEIEGKTKASTGEYKRQLVFYKLLADLDKTFVGRVTQVGLDFVEPEKETKTFKKELFVISDEEVAELRVLIKAVGERIKKLEFPKTTQYKSCEDCKFRAVCWPDGALPIAPEQLTMKHDSLPSREDKED